MEAAWAGADVNAVEKVDEIGLWRYNDGWCCRVE